MTNTENATETETYVIDWDMGEYGPFASYAEARDYQLAHRMRGSSITRI